MIASGFTPNELLTLDQQAEPMPATDDEPSNIGEAIENFAVRFWDMDHERATHYDARTAAGIPVQTKGARWRMCNGHGSAGQKYAHGRFRLYETDHDWLAENNGLYAFVVYEKPAAVDIVVPVYARLLQARVLDDWVLPDDPWYSQTTDVRRRKANGTDYRLPWPSVFPDAEGTI